MITANVYWVLTMGQAGMLICVAMTSTSLFTVFRHLQRPINFISPSPHPCITQQSKRRISRILHSFLLEIQSTYSLFSGLSTLKRFPPWNLQVFCSHCMSEKQGGKQQQLTLSLMSNTTLSFVGQVFFCLNIHSIFKRTHSQVSRNKCKEGVSNLSRLRDDPQRNAVVKNRARGIGTHRL